jgi:hypothetical protein
VVTWISGCCWLKALTTASSGGSSLGSPQYDQVMVVGVAPFPAALVAAVDALPAVVTEPVVAPDPAVVAEPPVEEEPALVEPAVAAEPVAAAVELPASDADPVAGAAVLAAWLDSADPVEPLLPQAASNGAASALAPAAPMNWRTERRVSPPTGPSPCSDRISTSFASPAASVSPAHCSNLMDTTCLEQQE